MIEDVLEPVTVSAGDGASGDAGVIDLSGAGLSGDEGVIYIFPSTRPRPVEVVSSPDQSDGLVVPAEVPWVIGTFRAQDGASQYLHASPQTSVDVLIVSTGGELGGIFSKPLFDGSGAGGGTSASRIIHGADDLPFEDRELQDTPDSADVVLPTSGARALASVGSDEVRTLKPGDYVSGASVDAANSYSTPGTDDSIEVVATEPHATVIVSAVADSGTSDVDFQVREAPEAEGTMQTGSGGWHQLDEATGVAAGNSYKKRFDLSGRALNFRFREATTDGGATVTYDVTVV